MLTSAEISKFIKVIYIYASETLPYVLSENDIVYCLLCFGDISLWNQKSLLNFYWVNIFFDILIANISWTVAQTPYKPYQFLKDCNKNFQIPYK